MTQVTILTHDPRWKGQLPGLRKAAMAALKAEKSNNYVTIVLTDDNEVRALNKNYRGKDKPTNVLSFTDGSPNGRLMQLGDIVLAYETIAKEADLQGKSLSHHAQHLVVHGVLHLLGYDHESPRDAQAMEAREIRILSGLSIANPYLAG
jgi:probable rRNA maturation factor